MKERKKGKREREKKKGRYGGRKEKRQKGKHTILIGKLHWEYTFSKEILVMW